MATVDTIIRQNQSQTDVLHFPKSIGKYGMLFMFADYNYDLTRKTITDKDIGKYKGSVVLPLPRDGLVENSEFKVGGTELGIPGATVAAGLSDPSSMAKVQDAETIFNNASSSVEGFVGAAAGAFQVAGALPAIVAMLNNRKTSFVAGLLGAQGLIKSVDVATGQTTNNFEALTFDGVQLRNHSFSWTLFPESYEDTKMIDAIKKKFLGAAHPTYTFGNTGDSVLSRVLFDYPQMVLPIILIGNEAEHYFQFKPCLIRNVKFSYKGDAGMAFYRNGAPATVEMTLDLTESGIWTGEDYKRGGYGYDKTSNQATRVGA